MGLALITRYEDEQSICWVRFSLNMFELKNRIHFSLVLSQNIPQNKGFVLIDPFFQSELFLNIKVLIFLNSERY